MQAVLYKGNQCTKSKYNIKNKCKNQNLIVVSNLKFRNYNDTVSLHNCKSHYKYIPYNKEDPEC